MKRLIKLSLASVLAIASLQAAEVSKDANDLESMFANGKVSGQIREFSISRHIKDDRTNKSDFNRKANAIGGHLKYETADYKGLSLGAAFYTTNGFDMRDDKASNKEVDPTLLGKDNESYSMLGEAYLQFKYENTTFKGGRQKLNTPMAGADDARMIPNLFEAYVLVNTDLANTTLIAAHVTKFAQGTFGRAYSSANVPNKILAATSGYSAVDPDNQVGDFENMGTYALGESTSGVSIAAVTYTGIEDLKLQLWDYYAHDILNIVYGQVDYSWTCLLNDNVKPFVAGQFIKENDVGDSQLKALGGDGNNDAFYYGLKFGAKVENFTAYVAYSETSENDDGDSVYENAIISPWGGMPAFTQGMVTRHVFLAGTKATKVALSYNWKNFGPDLKTVAYYASYDMDKNNGYTNDDTSESGLDFIYKPSFVKNLSLRARANFSKDFYTDSNGDSVGWDEYRFIVNYNF